MTAGGELPALLRRLHEELARASTLDEESKQLLGVLARDLQRFELTFISSLVAQGSGTFMPVKMLMNFGSMKVMKKMTMTTPTHATMMG